jgi:hypothetical protein
MYNAAEKYVCFSQVFALNVKERKHRFIIKERMKGDLVESVSTTFSYMFSLSL